MKSGDRFYLIERPRGNHSHLWRKCLHAGLVFKDGSIFPVEEFVLVPKWATTRWRVIACWYWIINRKSKEEV